MPAEVATPAEATWSTPVEHASALAGDELDVELDEDGALVELGAIGAVLVEVVDVRLACRFAW